MEDPHEQAVATPPIAKLHADLLWRIFVFNAVMERLSFDDIEIDAPLTTARYTSQVCASWRQLIISSSSLWGNIIDLNSLHQKSDMWRNEVLVRTGNSPLSISGFIYQLVDGPDILQFFESLLQNHWTRIVRVVVEIGWAPRKLHDDTWSALACPAPNLKAFLIQTDSHLPDCFLSPGLSLFANYAPLLTRFDQPNHAPINPNASWLPGITSLSLNSVPTLSILLDMCSRMHSLQALKLSFSDKDPTPGIQLRSVNLPSLTTLDIHGALNVALEFLDNITPSPGCSLRLSLRLPSNFSNPSAELLFSHRIIGGFADNYFSHHICSTCYLRYTPRDIRVEAISYDNSYNKAQSNFAVFTSGHPRSLTSAIALFSATLLPAYFSHATTLHLSIAPLTTAHSLGPLFCEFMTTMVTLEKLHVTTGGLNLFGVLQQRFFPRLKTLVWVPSITNVEEWEESTNIITDFLAMRRKIGFPIETLEWEMLSGVPMDINKFEELIGLKVVWQEISDDLELIKENMYVGVGDSRSWV